MSSKIMECKDFVFKNVWDFQEFCQLWGLRPSDNGGILAYDANDQIVHIGSWTQNADGSYGITLN